jgi:hypothetical protein
MGHKWGPSATFVGALLLVALVVVLLLWATLIYGGADSTPSTTVLPPEPATAATERDTGEPATAANGDAEPAAAQPVEIASVVAFDPEGDDRSENDELAIDALADDDPATEWRTVCYSGNFMGGKRGVGLIVSFDAPTDRALRMFIANGPFQVSFFASPDDAPPSSIDAWGERFDSAFGSEDELSTDPTPPNTRHVLILLTEIGQDPGCSDDHPFRGGLGEIQLAG